MKKVWRGASGLSWAMIIGPAVLFGGLVWVRRWISDDGFINARIVNNFLAGYGPVYNPGERVEVGTSTLWLVLVAAVKAITPGVSMGVVMVSIGVVLSTASFVFLGMGARHLARSGRSVLPLGLIILLAIPVVWDFGTSGLETSLSMAWIGAIFWALARRWSQDRPDRAAWDPWWIPVLIGLGPLVRPNFALTTLVFGVALLFQARRSLGGWLGAAGLALAVPLVYEVFRAGYYANLVPNTALAKSGGSIADGLGYLKEFLKTYSLMVPIVLVLVLVIYLLLSDRLRDRGRAAVILAPLLAAGFELVFVVFAGGDFMHGRFLIPALFLMVAPVAVVSVELLRAVGAVLAVSILLGWGVGSVTTEPHGGGSIMDERRAWAGLAGLAPSRLVDPATWRKADWAESIATPAVTARRVIVDDQQLTDIPLASDSPQVWILGSVGMNGFMAGPTVRIFDTPSLADPIGARMDAPKGQEFRTGHVFKPTVWAIARYADPDYQGEERDQLTAAREALTCAPVRELLAAVSDPLTPERFKQNLVQAPGLTVLRFSSDPLEARAELCG